MHKDRRRFAGSDDAARASSGNFVKPPCQRTGGKRQRFSGSCKRHTTADFSIEFRVKDEGGGISPDHIERIYEAYFSTKEKGTGLGLAIVKQNVELYGGAIELQSELGKGTEFVITLPTRALQQT